MNRVDELRTELALAEEAEGAAQAALAEKGRFARFYVAHYGQKGFVGLVCKACNRWDDAGHASDCSTGELERLV